MHVGDAMLHVAVDSVLPGTAWNQIGGSYASRTMMGGQFVGQKPGTLIDGKPVEHDFVYLVSRFTASGPKYP
jgi:hypothetical protein